MKDELETQWEQDIEDYGDNAYLMWKSFGIRDYPHKIYANFNSNDEATDIIINGFDDSMERKQSAALPFDLVRAKAGDEIQWIANDELFEPLDVKFVNIWSENADSPYFNMANVIYHGFYERVSFADLRMKYPPKVSK